MTNQPSSFNQKHLDSKYFVDDQTFNCPFCMRNNVAYTIVRCITFDWNNTKQCYVYTAQCSSCKKISMHSTFDEIDLMNLSHSPVHGFKFVRYTGDLDRYFFSHVPSSSFVLDENIDKKLRELFSEAESSLAMNNLIGASAAARKLVYEIAIKENACGDNYEERIKGLKKIRPDVDAIIFDTLLTVQQATSDHVHEDSYDGWHSEHLRLILKTLQQALHEMYVLPAQKAADRKSLLDLKEKILSKKKTSPKKLEKQDDLSS